MKRFLLIVSLVICCSLLASCEKETILTVNQSSLSFENKGGNQTISVVANKVWKASANQSWCKVSPSSGDGSDNSNITLSVSCDANDTYDERTCTITVTCEELTKTIAVSQSEGKGLIVSQTEYNLTNAEQTISVEVKANVQFSVEIDAACKSWIKQASTKGLSSNIIKFAISKNEDYDGREGKITIKQKDGSMSGVVVVKQSQQNGLFISTPEYNLSNEQHTLTVEVKSNVEFEVSPKVDWIRYVETKGLKTNQIILDVSANDGYDKREGTVVVKQKNGDLSGTIKIKQDEKYGILVTQSEYNLSNEAQTIDVEVKHNVDFDVVIPDECKDWVEPISSKSLSSKTFTFSVGKNETYDNRKGSITFKQKNGPISGSVFINQAQTDYLSVEKDYYSVSREAQTLSIKVNSNIEYNVEIEESAQSWISKIGTKTVHGSFVGIDISKNEEVARTGEVILNGNNEHVRIRIVQDGINPVLLYTTTDGQPICPNTHPRSVKLEIVSNTYENGIGRLVLCDTVTVLPRQAFVGCNTLASIVIPNEIVAIGYCTFAGCDNLEYAELPQTINEIGAGAFNVCKSLKRITLPEGIISLEDYVFAGCYNLEAVNIPKSVSIIKERAFMRCPLTEIDIPGSVKVIGADAFEECPNLESVVLNEGIEQLFCAFENCKKLKSVTLPSSLKESYEAFVGCSGLIAVNINDGITRLGERVFANCTSLTDVRIPDSVIDIGNKAFEGCSSLKSIKLPDRLLNLGGSAFYGCSSLIEIEVPDSVTSLGGGTFYYCTNLERVVLPSTTNCTLLSCTFFGCDKLTEIEIPHGVTELFATFRDCSSLRKVVLPNTISKLDYETFYGCSNLKEIELHEGTTTIGERAFYACSSLENLTIPSTVTLIGDWAFWGCRELLTITILPIHPPFLEGYYVFSTGRDFYVPKGCLDLYLADPKWCYLGGALKEMVD